MTQNPNHPTPLEAGQLVRILRSAPADKWAAAVTNTPPRLEAGDIALAFDVSRDGAWTSIAIAGGDIRDAYVELIEHRPDTGWLPARLVELELEAER